MGNAKNIPINPDAFFLPYQENWINDNSRLCLMEKSRQIGISFADGFKSVKNTAWGSFANDTWVSSKDDLQAMQYINYSKKFAMAINQAIVDEKKIYNKDKDLTAHVIRFKNGKSIYGLSSNVDAQVGKAGTRKADEFAVNPKNKELYAIAYPGITWGGTFEIISTHRGSHNFFNKLIEEIKNKGNPKNISHHKVTLQDALDQGFLYKLQQVLPENDERQAMDEKEYFDFIRAGCADEESFQQEYMCNPADDERAFLEYNLIASCEYPEKHAWNKPLSGGTLVAGIDIGRTKNLTVIWVLELQGDVWHTVEMVELENMSKPDQEKVLWPIMEKCFRVCIDYTGLGIGWGDDAQAHFGEYHSECVTFTNKVKETLAYPVRNAFEQKKIRIPFSSKVRADLRSVSKQTTTAGNIRFTAENRPDGHADRFWALALAIHASSGYMGEIEFTGIGNSAVTDRRKIY